MNKSLPFVLFIISCSGEEECPNYNFQNQFNYETSFSQVTTSGIQVDFSEQNLSLNLVDVLTKETEDCLTKNFPDKTISQNAYLEADCLVHKLIIPFNRNCFKVKVPNNWIWSCDRTQQLLPYAAPQKLCDDKGFSYDSNCPCRWRAGIQNSDTIVTTPNFKLYKEQLLKLTTSCNNIWNDLKLAECVEENYVEY